MNANARLIGSPNTCRRLRTRHAHTSASNRAIIRPVRSAVRPTLHKTPEYRPEPAGPSPAVKPYLLSFRLKSNEVAVMLRAWRKSLAPAGAVVIVRASGSRCAEYAAAESTVRDNRRKASRIRGRLGQAEQIGGRSSIDSFPTGRRVQRDECLSAILDPTSLRALSRGPGLRRSRLARHRPLRHRGESGRTRISYTDQSDDSDAAGGSIQADHASGNEGTADLRARADKERPAAGPTVASGNGPMRGPRRWRTSFRAAPARRAATMRVSTWTGRVRRGRGHHCPAGVQPRPLSAAYGD